MKKKKGFTLIELLAVIVILAVIALIATPLIMGVINDSKKAAFKEQINNIIHAAELDMGADPVLPASYSIVKEGLVKDGKTVALSKPIDGTGTLYVNKNASVAIKITNDKYCGYKKYDDKEVTIKDGNCDDIDVVKWSDWLTEEELTALGKDKNDPTLKTKNQYQLTYNYMGWKNETVSISAYPGVGAPKKQAQVTCDARPDNPGDVLWFNGTVKCNEASSGYQFGNNVNNYQWLFTSPRVRNVQYQMYFSSGGTNLVKANSYMQFQIRYSDNTWLTPATPYASSGTYNTTVTSDKDKEVTGFRINGQVVSNGLTAGVFFQAFIRVNSWDRYQNIVEVTEWQDTNTTDLGTITKTDTRTMYSYEIN